MPHKIEADAERSLVVAYLEGDATRVEVIDMIKAARTLAHARRWNILYDVRASKLRMSSGEIFWLPRKLDVLRAPGAARVRVAILHHLQMTAKAKFWETAFRNAGLQACAFADKTAALRWLGA